MRLDLFLKLSRIIPRRTLAQEFCDKGLIKVNNTPAKSAKEIKAGDELEIRRRSSVSRFKILTVPAKKQLSRTEAETIYELLSTEAVGEPGNLA